MIAALDSTASIIWLVMLFFTIDATELETMNQSRSIPEKVIIVVIMLMRVASFWLIRDLITFPLYIKSSVAPDVSKAL